MMSYHLLRVEFLACLILSGCVVGANVSPTIISLHKVVVLLHSHWNSNNKLSANARLFICSCQYDRWFDFIDESSTRWSENLWPYSTKNKLTQFLSKMTIISRYVRYDPGWQTNLIRPSANRKSLYWFDTIMTIADFLVWDHVNALCIFEALFVWWRWLPYRL